MTSTIGECSVVKQEVCQRIMSEALVYSSCAGRYMSLENQLSEISIENNNDNGNESTITVVLSILDAYGRRMDQDLWFLESTYSASVDDGLTGMNLDRFALNYVVGKSSRVRNKIKKAPSDTFVMFKPNISSHPSQPTYARYCNFFM